MTEATIVALVILVGVFIIMALTILKSGAEAAIKMWGVMGALTGVAFGAITTYYFADRANKTEVARLESTIADKEVALRLARADAEQAEARLASLTDTYESLRSTAGFPRNALVAYLSNRTLSFTPASNNADYLESLYEWLNAARAIDQSPSPASQPALNLDYDGAESSNPDSPEGVWAWLEVFEQEPS